MLIENKCNIFNFNRLKALDTKEILWYNPFVVKIGI